MPSSRVASRIVRLARPRLRFAARGVTSFAALAILVGAGAAAAQAEPSPPEPNQAREAKPPATQPQEARPPQKAGPVNPLLRQRARQPGLQVRFYDVGDGLAAVPRIHHGELPNAISVVPTLDLRGERGDFGELKDGFVTQVDGFLKIDEPGGYTFRLSSDDGSKLWIDDQLVIDNDGLHGPDPRDGVMQLDAGEHVLRVMHFEASGGEQLTLMWRTPSAASQTAYELIPADRLAYDMFERVQTLPGKKRVILPLRRGLPGDGSDVAGMNPGFRGSTAEEWSGKEQERAALRQALQQYAQANAAAIPGGMTVRCWKGERPSEGVQLRRVVESDPNAVELVAWLPAETGMDNPGVACTLRDGPLSGQLLIPDHATGTIHRAFVELVEGRPQGCIFRFSGRQLVGIEVLATTNEGGAGVGYRGFTSPRTDETEPTVQRFMPQAPAFEMLAVRAMSNGLEVEFTKPLDPRCGWEADSFLVEQWPYYASKGDRRPLRDGTRTPVKSASVSQGRRVFLEIPTLEADRVVYLRLLPPCVSESGEKPVSTEAWYTMQRKPTDRKGEPMPPPAGEPQNVLTDAEKAAGWKLLFDGKTTAGWRGWKRDDMPAGWQALDGCLTRVGSGGDIVTVEQYDNFELSLEWRISQGGNSGIFFRVSEQPPNRYVWETGPEMQVLDDAEHADGRSPLTSAGSNYALHAPSRADALRPVGLFNQVRIVANGPHVEHWLNGEKIVEYELDSPEWEKLVAASKFSAMPRYGRTKSGYIALQDHGDKVWYRNVKIRRILNE